MATNLQRISAVDPCIPPAVRKELQKAAANVEQNITFEGDVYDNLLVEINSSNPISYFTNAGVPALPGDTVVARHVPPLVIQLTTDMTESAGVWTASAKLVTYSAGYAVTGSAFTITDALDMWHHSMTGDRGILNYEERRGVLFPERMNTPYLRTGVLNTTDLAATTLASPSSPQTVVVNSVNFSVYGVLIPTGKELVKSSTTYVTFYYDNIANKYFAISTNTCATIP